MKIEFEENIEIKFKRELMQRLIQNEDQGKIEEEKKDDDNGKVISITF